MHIKHVKSLSAEYLPVVRPWLHDSIEDRPVYRMRDNRGTAARALLEVYWALLDAPPAKDTSRRAYTRRRSWPRASKTLWW